jgi:hypothetical protein
LTGSWLNFILKSLMKMEGNLRLYFQTISENLGCHLTWWLYKFSYSYLQIMTKMQYIFDTFIHII